MLARWRVAQRASTASSAALRPAVTLQRIASDPSGLSLHVRPLSTASEPRQATPSHAPRGRNDQARARRCLSEFSKAMRSARTVDQLTTKWAILSREDPLIVMPNGRLELVGARVQSNDKQSGPVAIPADSLAVRMVRVPNMVSLIQQGKRHTVLEKTPRTDVVASNDMADMFVPHDRVLLVSEMFVVHKILRSLFQLRCYLEVAQFVEAYEAESRKWRASAAVQSGNADALVEELTTLGENVDAMYLASLGKLKEHAKVCEQFEQRGGGALIPFLFSANALHHVLDACQVTREGPLARSIMDDVLDNALPSVPQVWVFEMGLRACLHGDKTVERLQHAMHIYRRMVHEVGYIPLPQEWSLLFSTAVALDQDELAMEVSRAYRVNGIAPMQKPFQFAIHHACRNAKYDLAIAMTRSWLETEPEFKPLSASQDAAESTRLGDEVARRLNKILWIMLAGPTAPSRDHVEQMLLLMQSRECYAGGRLIIPVVKHFFTTASDMAPDAVVSQFIDLWERVPAVVQRTSRVVHLVLEQCQSRAWSEQWDRVVEYAQTNRISLPFTATAQLMEFHASVSRFKNAVELGELAMQPHLEQMKEDAARAAHPLDVDPSRFDIIPDAFFENLLQCYVALERFDDVARVDDAFKLTARRSDANEALAKLLRDAQHAGAR